MDPPSAQVAKLYTPSGQVITINGREETGTIAIDGSTYPITNSIPATVRRKLDEVAPLREIKMKPVASDVISFGDEYGETSGVQSDEYLVINSEVPHDVHKNRREMRRGGRQTIRRSKNMRRAMMGGGSFRMGQIGFQGNH